MKKNLVITCLILILIAGCINVYAEELTDLINKQTDLQNQKDGVDANLEIVQSELSETLQQIQKLNDNIASYENEINDINSKVVELQSSISDIQSKLDVAQLNYDKQKKLLEDRLVSMYEAGETSFLDFILSSNNIAEFISNYYLMTELTNYDTELLDNIEKEKSQIEYNKKMLESQKQEYNTAKENQEKKKIILYNTKMLKNSYSNQLTEQEKELENQIETYRTQITEVEAEILKITTANLDSKYIGGQMAWPVPGYTRVTSTYGMRTHPITGIYKLHTGVDIGAPMGANFVAANDGVVVKAEFNNAYGNMVIINHGGGTSTLYAHGSEILVAVGQTIKRGEPILKVGSTGYSTGAHAHFEVRINGQTTDPLTYITNNANSESENKTEE